MSEEGIEKEGRTTIDGVPVRLLAGVDGSGNYRILRCDADGYLLCKVVAADEADFEPDTEES